MRPVTDPFALVAKVEELGRREVWPGFAPRSLPLALATGEHTLLFGHPQPPPEFTPVPDHPAVAVFPGRHPAMRAHSVITLGGHPTATVLLDHHGRRTRTDLAALVIHELFHVYQRTHHPEWTANEAELFVYPVDDGEHLHLRRLETAALRRAVQTPLPATSAQWTAAALELRRARFARLPPGAIAYERGNELQEGLATYVEWRAAWPTRRPRLPAQGFAAADVRRRCYVVGHVPATLLDDLAPEWPRELEAGRAGSLDELLHARLHAHHPVPARFSPATRAAARARAEAEIQDLAVARAARLASVRAQPGWRIMVLAAEHHPLWPHGFDPSRVQLLTLAHVLHERWLRLGNDAATLEVLDRAALTEAAGAHPLFEGVRWLEVAGLTTEPSVQRMGKTIRIVAAGFEGTFQEAHVESRDQTVTVRVGQIQPVPWTGNAGS